MPPRPRKRVRRRRVSENFDDSSDSSSSSSASAQSNQSTSNNPNSGNKSSSSDSHESSSESESTHSSSSSSSSSSSGSSINRPTAKRGRLAKKQARALQPQEGGDPQTMRRSPSPVEQSPPPPLPSSFFDPDLALPYLDSSPEFSLPAGFESNPTTTRHLDGLLQSPRQQLEQDEERFRAWYMATIVDRFPNELDLLRASDQRPQKTQANLDVLVAALGSGVDIFDDHIILPSTSSSSTNVAPDNLALDDHQLVLQSLDLAKQALHLDPSICPQPPSSPQSHQDVLMSDGADS